MSETLSGGCLCGDVRYEVRGTPVHVFHCHCSMCRRAGGTAFQTWAGFGDDALTVTQGNGGTLQVLVICDPEFLRTLVEASCSTITLAGRLRRCGSRWGSLDHP